MATGFGITPTFARAKISDSFFSKLIGEAKIIADEVAHKTASDLKFSLSIRGNLAGNNGRYPKWDGSNGEKSNASYRGWAIKKHKNGEYFISNNTKSNDSWYWNYPYNLLYGKGWSAKVVDSVRAGTAKNLEMNDGGIFSTQMRHGIKPVLKIKRKQMLEELEIKLRRKGK